MNTESRVYFSKGKLVILWLIFSLWLLGAYPFLFQLLFSYEAFQSADGRLMPLFELAFILLGGVLCLKNRADMAVAGSFVLLAFVSTVIVNERPLSDWINGIRFYVPLLFMLPIIRYAMATEARRDYFMELMDRSLYLFLWLQGPCMIYQLITMGGWDYGGGSLGVFQSGIISELIYMISFYLMIRRWDMSKGYFTNIACNWILVFLLYPSFLNETKSSFLFMLMYFVFLMPLNRRTLKTLAIMIPVTAVAMWAFIYVYNSLYGNKVQSRDTFSLEYLDWYVLGDAADLEMMELAYEATDFDEEVDFQRGLKMAAVPWIMEDQKRDGVWIFGNGVGILKGHSEDDPSDLGGEYKWLFQGTAMTLQMLVLECGALGVVWLIAAMIVLFHRPASMPKKRNRNRQMYGFLVSMLVAVLFYNTSMNIIIFGIIYYYMSFLCSRWSYTDNLGNITPGAPMLQLGGIFTKVRYPRVNTDKQ